jgi:cell division septation protein DedD
MHERPRLYRVCLFDGTRQVLGGHEQVLVLDLTPGDGLREAAARLDALLAHLRQEAQASGEPTGRFHLSVADLTGTARFRWPTPAPSSPPTPAPTPSQPTPAPSQPTPAPSPPAPSSRERAQRERAQRERWGRWVPAGAVAS